MITSSAIVFLGMAVMTMIAFNLGNSLRAAINRGETVRNVAKGFCSGFCILVAILFLIAHLDLSYGAPQALIFFFHAFIVAFQMAMIWFPPPK
ncbi:hypothetical protein N9V00_02810 [Bacteroidota bacterium]|jgi:hypothetical protein|nr:hypothetical protein [Gammaproteobacteria bacterium]MDA9715982.1 hypothetical protein [Bacteroidota bacterium]MEC7479384.1 hypothetical protein [Pseudomonadota bacterium]MAO98657.1 hypothetical protein [Gammaproteobacteria bacterium]MEC7859513.1 hypothetical protein [Pseudomonadota bacterium]|tara:strand:+ start:1404 stop:1682 length:279 start_codon:yes stop_codon:yes gene_type:complete